MAGRVASSLEVQKLHGSFTSVLTSAFLEWLLIFMLLVNGVLGYIITRFACYCELQMPCLLCSRIDHILGSEKVGFYWDLICGSHKLEISSVVFCHFHEKLVDVRGMCESCLFSFATKDKSNAETYRLLVGKLGAEEPVGFDEDPFIDDYHKPKNSKMKRCSCCNELWTSRSHAQTLLQTKSIEFDSTDLDIALNRDFMQDVNGLRKEATTSSEQTVMTRIRGEMEDSSVHFKYTELKITSDSESEIHESDNDDLTALISGDPLRDLMLDSTPIEPLISVSEDDSTLNKQKDIEVLSPEPSIALCQVQSDSIEPHEDTSVAVSPAVSNGLEELNWLPNDQKLDEPASTELVNFNHLPESSNRGNVSSDFSKDSLDIYEAETMQSLAHRMNDKTQVLESTQNTTDFNSSKSSPVHNSSTLRPGYLDLGDAYKLAVGSRGRQLSNTLTEQFVGKDSPVVSEDLKLLLSQLSRGFEFPFNDILSPRLSRNREDFKTNDSLATVGLKLLQKRLSLERNDSRSSLDRNESGFESLDFSTVSEIEGESELDRLKRQLEHERKSMVALFKELEEERNASAIATNEAMAMITRLQEEKAALQMEASHGIRMMEEQAEYDMEALEKLDSLVTEKDKEIQDLEAELEHFRAKYPNDSFFENVGAVEPDASLKANLKGTPKYSYAEDHGHSVENDLAEDTKSNPKDAWLKIEDEREYILQCLNDLEKKLNVLSRNTVNSEVTIGDQLENRWENPYDSNLHEEYTQRKNELDEIDAKSRQDAFISRGSRRTLVRRVQSFKTPRSKGSSLHKEADIVALGDEVTILNERLQALEADRNFLERISHSLENGDGTLILEIASQLQELRRIGVRKHQVLS